MSSENNYCRSDNNIYEPFYGKTYNLVKIFD